jgi:hypothetical protein
MIQSMLSLNQQGIRIAVGNGKAAAALRAAGIIAWTFTHVKRKITPADRYSIAQVFLCLQSPVTSCIMLCIDG